MKSNIKKEVKQIMVKHTRAKINIPICIAIFLFCLTLISAYLTCGLYAKYISSAYGSDSSRVTTFGNITLTETGDFNSDGKLVIIPGVNLTKKAVINFAGSEAATYVFVEVIPSAWQISANNKSFLFTLNDKTVMQWSIEESWTFLESDNGTYIYYRKLPPNSVLDGANIIADGGKITVSNQITKSEISSMTGISIKLRASVVQAGGFESPNAAWASIASKEGV